jgi:hypothetical protein
MEKGIEEKLIQFSSNIGKLLFQLQLEDKILAEAVGTRLMHSSFGASLEYSDVQMSDSEEVAFMFIKNIPGKLISVHYGIRIIDKINIMRERELLTKVLKESKELVGIFQDEVNNLNEKILD